MLGPVSLSCLAPLAPASAGSVADGVHWVLHPRPSTATHGSDAYKVRAWITDATWRQGENQREQAIKIVVSQARGDGEMRALQTHAFTFFIDWRQQPGFTHRSDLRSARVRAEQHRYGQNIKLDLRFTSSRSKLSSCNGHTVARHGRLSGSVLFRPADSDIGRITSLSSRATLTHGDGTCPIDRSPNGEVTAHDPCPMTTSVALGETAPRNLMFLVARRDPGSSTATINVTAWEDGPPDVWHTIEATVPAGHVQIASDFSSVEIRGGPGTFLHGTARGTQSGPPTPWNASAGCPEGSSAEGSLQAPEGNYTGDFEADFFIGGARSIGQWPVQATAYMDVEQR